MNKSSLRHFVIDICGYAFFNKLTMLTPVFAVFIQSHGVSDFQLSWLFMLYSIAIVVTQMPVTWITNRIGRRPAIILGQTLKAIGFSLWFLWPTFWGFGIGVFLWGMQYAFSEVALDALIYDELVARNRRKLYTAVLGRQYTAAAFGIALSAFGSLMMFMGYGWVTLASVIALGISILFVLDMRLIQSNTIYVKNNLVGLLRSGFRICRRNPCVLMFMVICMMLVDLVYLDDYFSPIGISIGLPVEYVGIIPFIMLGCNAMGRNAAHRFSRISNTMIYCLIGLIGMLFVGFSIFYSVGGLLILGAAYFISAIVSTILYSRFQDSIPTQYRSILLSFYSFGVNLIYIFVCFIIGLGGSLGSWRYGVLMLGALLIWLGLWAMISFGHDCKTDVAATMPKCIKPQRCASVTQ